MKNIRTEIVLSCNDNIHKNTIQRKMFSEQYQLGVVRINIEQNINT